MTHTALREWRRLSVGVAQYSKLSCQPFLFRCCNGRLVSVLEGGYRIHGGLVSAFARSVAAHVRSLAEPHGQAWDPEDAKVCGSAIAGLGWFDGCSCWGPHPKYAACVEHGRRPFWLVWA